MRVWGLALALAVGGPPVSAAALLPDGDCAGVYWDWTAVFDGGERIYARVLVTRQGPGARAALAQGHWIDAEGVATPFENGRSEGSFEADAALSSLRIGSTHMELRGTRRELGTDNDKRGVKLLVEAESPRSGGSPLREEEREGLAIAAVDVGLPAAARVWRRGMQEPRALRGHLSVVRTRHAACERELAHWRMDLHGLSGGTPWLLVHQRLTSGARLAFAQVGHASAAPIEAHAASWRTSGDARVPGRVRLDGALHGHLEIGPAHLSVDPLAGLPRLVRMLYWSGPQPRRIWADASPEIAWAGGVELPGDPLATRASVASFTFLQPPPERDPPSLPDTGG